ncbi:sugar phosphate isomerase/epimerase family protein [Cohaesibacter celericrescens]|nr:sugar phosphate isomerase/epimerase family protein [Cohaesibacter celericrescens]
MASMVTSQKGGRILLIGFNMLLVDGKIGLEHLSILQKLKNFGYDGVEIPVLEGETQHYRDLGKAIRDIGLRVTASTALPSEVNPLSPDQSVRNRAADFYKWLIEASHELGAELVVGPVHSPIGYFTGNGPTEQETERCVEAMRILCDEAHSVGIGISLEAVNRFECYIVNTLEAASEIYQKVNHPAFGYMFDTFHANIEEKDPVAALRTYRNGVTHVHISENDRGIPGRGHVDFRKPIKLLRETGYDQWITVEAFGRSLPALAAATRVWRDLFEDRDTLFAESIDLIRKEWAFAGDELGMANGDGK